MQRRLSKNSFAMGQQMGNLKQGASNAFNRDYGYNLKNVPYGSGDDENMGIDNPNKPFYAGENLYAPYGNVFNSVAGKDEDSAQENGRTTRYWGNNQNAYDEKNINISTKDSIMNPRWASAVRRGENALNNTIRRNDNKRQQ